MRQRENQRMIPGGQEHLRALGFESLVAYQTWCTTHKLRGGLRKGQKEKERECALRTSQLIPPLTPVQADRERTRAHDQLAQALHFLARNQRSKYLVSFPHFWELKPLFVKARRDTRTCDAFVCLLRQVWERQFDGLRRFESLGSELPGALLALAQQSCYWIRDPESWEPKNFNERQLLHSLARHLLARYPVPAFFDTAWLKDNKAQQRWFRWVALGRNLRELELPLRLTSKMAHIVMTEVPESVATLTQALRWAQVRGLGGSPALANAVVGTSLGEGFPHEAFWETVVQFLVNNPGIPIAQVGPLIDYLRFEREEPHWADDIARLPQGFTMKGRTAAALLERMQQWHTQLRWRSRFSVESWPSCGLPSKSWEAEGGAWELVELTQARALVSEGDAMHHCVASYGQRCISGEVSIWSLRHQSEDNKLRRVMTVRLSRSGVIQEARGKYNASPTMGFRSLTDEGDQKLLLEGAQMLRRWARETRLELASGVV